MDDYYVLIKGGRVGGWRELIATVFVKEAGFFISQKGDREDWGKSWIKVKADNIEDARSIGQRMFHDSPQQYMN